MPPSSASVTTVAKRAISALRALVLFPALVLLAACASARGPVAGVVDVTAPVAVDTFVTDMPERNEPVRVAFPPTDALQRRYIGGRYEALAGDSLVVHLPHSVDTIALTGGRELQVPRWTDRGTVGYAVGWLVGMVGGVALVSHCTDTSGMGPRGGCSLAALAAVVSGGFLGGAIGKQIGKAFRVGDGWVAVRLGVAPAADPSVTLRLEVGR